MKPQKLNLFFCSMLLLSCGMALADVADQVPIQDFLGLLLNSIGGFKGVGGIGAAALVTQLLMKGFQTPLADVLGKWKFTLVAVFSLASGVLALRVAGLTWGAALLHGSTLTAYQVLFHQAWKQFTEKPDPLAQAVVSPKPS